MTSPPHTPPTPHLPARMAAVAATDNGKGQQGCGDTTALGHGWWEWETGQLLCKPVFRQLLKHPQTYPHDPAIPLPGICPEDVGTHGHADRARARARQRGSRGQGVASARVAVSG